MHESALSEPTLVLNRNWQPLRICSARRALVLLFKDVARALLPDGYALLDFDSWIRQRATDGEPYVQTVSLKILVPEIIVLRQCDRYFTPQVVFSRRNLLRRDQHTCQYCGKKGPAEEMSIDHVVPRSRGGGASWTNCVVACRRCNTTKGDRPLKHSGLKLMRPPTEPAPHLAFSFHRRQAKPSWKAFFPGTGRRAGTGS